MASSAILHGLGILTEIYSGAKIGDVVFIALSAAK
jgi:hypothetical protein